MAEKISKEEVEHIAELTRLHLSSEEVDKFTDQLGDVLEYVESLPEASGQKPSSAGSQKSVASSKDRLLTTDHRLQTNLREDKVQSDEISTQELLENVPQTEGTSIKVPAVLGGGDE